MLKLVSLVGSVIVLFVVKLSVYIVIMGIHWLMADVQIARVIALPALWDLQLSVSHAHQLFMELFLTIMDNA